LIEVHRNIRAMQRGEALEVTADDPAFLLDIEAWCRRTGHTLMSIEHHSEQIIAVIRKET